MKKSVFEFSGHLVVENKTANSIHNVTGLLISLSNSGLDFKTRKVSEVASGNKQKWDFNFIVQDSNIESVKLKYVIRFFYNASHTDEAYR